MATPEQLAGQWSWREAWSLAFAIGVRPCTGALAVLIFSLGIGLFAAGIFATFAMAVGTAITVSTLAILAVSSRDLAVRLAGPDSVLGGRLMAGAGVVGSLIVFGMGTAFFFASLRGAGPL
jgi:nickel/cobalt transporter (NicO) family protein